ncbi:MAG: prenyltransferase/squalene oxidase repeat-containing protein [Candidatus Micrarchaeota archaeon]
MEKKIALTISFLLLVTLANAYPLPASDSHITSALSYLKSVQTADGCIGGFATSAWVIDSVAAAGQNPSSVSWQNSGKSLVDCIKKDAAWFNDSGRSATDFERQILAVVATDEDPANFNGLDYVTKLKSFFDGTQMGQSAYLNDDMWGIMALRAAGEPASSAQIQGMATFLESNQGADGSFSWGIGQAGDPDDTADAIMALISAGKMPDSASVQNGLAFLKTQQDSNIAGIQSFGLVNPDSTSHAVDSIVSAGQDPTDAAWQENDTNPVEYLLSWQQPNGGFSNPYANPPGSSSEWTTAGALNALLGKPYPVKIRTIAQNLQMPVRIEGADAVIVDTTVVLPQSFEFSATSGTHYSLHEPSLLMGLLETASENGFAVGVSDQWYPALGFYVNEIADQPAEGLNGWNVRVDNRSIGSFSSDAFIWQSSSPPALPHHDVTWYFGSWDANALRLTSNSTSVQTDENVQVKVEYFSEQDNAWYPVQGATVKGAAQDQLTDAQGNATIRFASGGTQNVFAEKPGQKYFRSKKLAFAVQGPEQSSTQVRLIGTLVPAVSFSVSPSQLNFGSFGPGYLVHANSLEVKNTGSWNLQIKASINDTNGTLYSSGLLLNDTPWNQFSLALNAQPPGFLNTAVVTSGLQVPPDFSQTGTQNGIVTFWATATQVP